MIKEIPELLAPKVKQAQPAPRVKPERLDLKETLVHKVHRAFKVLKEQQE